MLDIGHLAVLGGGPEHRAANPAEDANYPYFLCRQGDEALWYPFNSDTR